MFQIFYNSEFNVVLFLLHLPVTTLRVRLESLVTQDHKDCPVFKDNLDHLDLLDHRVHLEKLLLPLRH